MSISISNDAATSKVDEADEKTTNKRELSSRDELSGAEANLPVKKRKIELSSQDKHYESEDESDSDIELTLHGDANTGNSSVDSPGLKPRAKSHSHAEKLLVDGPYSFDDPSSSKGSVYETRWDRMYNLLLQCGSALGTCKIPLSYEVADADGNIIKLGLWLGTQRQLYRKGQLRNDKLQKLQSLVDAGKMDWGEVKALSDEARWNSMFELLLKYCESHGHGNVPERYVCVTESGESVKLGRWLDRQRGHMKKNKMRSDRLAKLQHLIDQNLLFGDALEEDDRKWKRSYDALCAYGLEHGNCNVPNSFVMALPNGTVLKLGTWLSTQRHLQKRIGKLRSDRFLLLQELVDKGMLKWGDMQLGKDEKWELCYAALLQYDLDHGNMNIPRMHESILADGTKVRLHRWLSRQVASFHENKLKADREIRLQELVNLGKLSWDMLTESQWNKSPIEDAQEYSDMIRAPGQQVVSSSMKIASDDSSENDIEPLDEYHVDALMNVADSGGGV